jgi:hypothetical protein
MLFRRKVVPATGANLGSSFNGTAIIVWRTDRNDGECLHEKGIR